MNPKIEQFLYLAEEQYLQPSELEDYQSLLEQLTEKLKVYETLRDQEVYIFKILADELQEQYPDERSQILSEALSQWSLALKYCSMAMILDNPDYLTARIKNWMQELIQLRNMPQIDHLLYETIMEVLPDILVDAQLALIRPYLEQVKALSGLNAESEQLLGIG